MTSRLLFLTLCLPLIQGNSLKRGVAVKKKDFLCDDLNVMNTMGWWYDWRCSLNYYRADSVCGPAIDQHEYNYVSMIWGFTSNTNMSCFEDGSDSVVGFNEPNHVKQSNLSPQETAEAWPEMESKAGSKILVSPSASGCSYPNCNYGNTTQWFDEFFRLCKDCRVDYLATHTYWCGVDKTMEHLENLFERYKRPIWLTEFACNDKKNNASRVYEFMEEMLPLLEASPFVARYAWFMLRIKDDSGWIKSSASLMEPNSSTLTPLGELYRDYVYMP